MELPAVLMLLRLVAVERAGREGRRFSVSAVLVKLVRANWEHLENDSKRTVRFYSGGITSRSTGSSSSSLYYFDAHIPQQCQRVFNLL